MFEVAGDAAIASDPGQRLLHDPSLWQDGEAFCTRFMAHDFQRPLAGFRYRRHCIRPLISLIGADNLDEGKTSACPLVHDQRGPVAILHTRRVDRDPEYQAKGIDEKMLLDALCLLARVIAGFLRFAPPFPPTSLSGCR